MCVHDVRLDLADDARERADRERVGHRQGERSVGGRVQRRDLGADVGERVHGDARVVLGLLADVEAGDVHVVTAPGQLRGEVADVPLLAADNGREELRELQDPHACPRDGGATGQRRKKLVRA